MTKGYAGVFTPYERRCHELYREFCDLRQRVRHLQSLAQNGAFVLPEIIRMLEIQRQAAYVRYQKAYSER